jgi:hypothetical protein
MSNARLGFFITSIKFIPLNKVAHTKVQYLSKYREAKSHNIILPNGTVLYIVPASTADATSTPCSTSTKFSMY